MEWRSSAPRSSSRSLSRPEKSAKTSAPPSSGVAPGPNGRTATFKSNLAERMVCSRNSRSASAAAGRSSWPCSIRFKVIAGIINVPISYDKNGSRSGFLAGFRGRRDRMRAVQIPLLSDANDAAGQDVHRETAGNREKHEHRGERNGHELHHHLLLRIGGGHRRHF